MVGRAVGRLADGMAEAAEALRGLLASGSEPVRLAAARAVLQLGVELRSSGVVFHVESGRGETDRKQLELTVGPPANRGRRNPLYNAGYAAGRH